MLEASKEAAGEVALPRPQGAPPGSLASAALHNTTIASTMPAFRFEAVNGHPKKNEPDLGSVMLYIRVYEPDDVSDRSSGREVTINWSNHVTK